MKTNRIVFKSVATIVISLWTIISFANDNPSLGQRSQHTFTAGSRAISYVSDTLSSATKSIRKYTDDSFITLRVKKKLLGESSIKSFDISVTTRDGFVTLTGFVTDNEIAIKAVQIATKVKGVKWVNDALLIKNKSKRTVEEFISDITITSKIKIGLLNKKGIPSLAIQVETVEGVVQLSGDVDSLDQQFHAEEVAREVVGVQDVKNNLVVRDK